MRSDKGEAFVLRRQGKSYSEIANRLGVAKSTLSSWFAGVDFSVAIKDELVKKATKKGAVHLRELNRVRGVALKAQYELAEKEALQDMQTFRHVPLFISGIMAYWSEGDKVSKNQVRFTNSDPDLIHVFITFLVKLCGVDESKIRLALHIYPDLSEAKCKRFWTKALGVKNFHKTQVLPSRNKTKRLPYGVCVVVLSDTRLKKKLNIWIDHLPEMVLNTVPQSRKS